MNFWGWGWGWWWCRGVVVLIPTCCCCSHHHTVCRACCWWCVGTGQKSFAAQKLWKGGHCCTAALLHCWEHAGWMLPVPMPLVPPVAATCLGTAAPATSSAHLDHAPTHNPCSKVEVARRARDAAAAVTPRWQGAVWAIHPSHPSTHPPRMARPCFPFFHSHIHIPVWVSFLPSIHPSFLSCPCPACPLPS
jgi:hypothetical protein